jgi:hypothetical protein
MTPVDHDRDLSDIALALVLVFLFLVGVLSMAVLAKDFVDSASRDMSFLDVPRCSYCAVAPEDGPAVFVRSCSGGCDEHA